MSQREEKTITILIKRCSRVIDQSIDELLKKHSIARSQYRVMYQVAKLDGPTQTDLIEPMRVKASTLTLIIDRLVEKGYIKRYKDSADNRSNKLQLTTEGKRIFCSIPDPITRINKKITTGLSTRDVEKVMSILSQIIKELS